MPNYQLARRLERARREILIFERKWSTLAGNRALKFVDGNFSAQGFRGSTLLPWKHTKSGKRQSVLGGKSQGILIGTGRLRRGTHMQATPGQARIYNNIRYARVHNEGFKGTVNVREYTRRRFAKGAFEVEGMKVNYGESYSLRTHRKLKDKKVVSAVITVKSHTANMNMPRRQFMPDNRRGSAILDKEIRDMTEKTITSILKTVR